jgi:creatinine amidohydrolase
MSTATAFAVLRDVTLSLKRQGITRLVLLNSHGGNDFKPMIRDLMLETGVFIALVNFWQMCMEKQKELFGDPGDHAGILETSLLMHWFPGDVKMDLAGKGERKPFAVKALEQKGVWTPRPWTKIHPDLGSGDPRGATAEKGKDICEVISAALADLLVELSAAKELP